MNIVLTGATGFAGAQVLRTLIADDTVSGVTCLVRRPPSIRADKVDVVVVNDFTAYDDALIARLAEHDACIWALGAKDSDVADPALYERITHTFTLALATRLASAGTAGPRRTTGPFTFCYLSGMGADQSEKARMPWQRLTRHLKGRTERDLLALGATRPDFDVRCFRPGGILPADTLPVVRLLLAPIAVKVDELATALSRVASRAATHTPPVIPNSQIRALSRRLSP